MGDVQAIQAALQQKGLHLQPDFISKALAAAGAPRDGDRQTQHVFTLALHQDLAAISLGTLPPNIQAFTGRLEGSHMLQIDEHVNISAAAKHRYEKANAGIKRCLKLMLTDGRQSFSGIEHKPIPDLTLGLPSGCKVLVSGPVQVVRGIAMLSPANFIILGGLVAPLQEARERAEQCWAKQTAGGVDGRAGTRAVDLAQWARAAAWGQNGHAGPAPPVAAAPQRADPVAGGRWEGEDGEDDEERAEEERAAMYADHDEQEGRRQWNQANPAGGRVAPPAPRLGQIPQIQRGVPLPLPRPVPVPAPHPPAAAAPVAIDDDDEDDDIVVVSSDGEGEPPPAKRPKVQHGDQVGATGGVYGEDDYGYADPGMDYGYYEDPPPDIGA